MAVYSSSCASYAGETMSHASVLGKFGSVGLLLILLGIPSTASAAKKLSVEQMHQALQAAQAAHRKDPDTAQLFVEVEAAARIRPEALQDLLAETPGPLTAQAIRGLAAISEFLEPPPTEIPQRTAPDVVAQKAILGQTVHYVARTLPTLPNFLAIRETRHYDDTPRQQSPGEWPTRDGFHYRTMVQAPVAFRNGRESDDPALLAEAATLQKTSNSQAKAASAPNLGLASWGEFGPILGLVLVDAAKGKLAWDRWELRDGKPVAVFQFAVDRANSHYTVQYSSSNSDGPIGSSYGTRQGRGQVQGVSAGQEKPAEIKRLKQATGYHGTLTVDAENGTILRIVIEADLRPDDPIQRAAMAVEYGEVKIGEDTHICPTRSVTLSLSHAQFQPSPTSALVDIVEQQLNEVAFTNYRRFGSTVTMMANLPEGPSVGSDAVPAAPAATSTEGTLNARPDAAIAAAAPQPAASEAQPAAMAPAAVPAPAAREAAEVVLGAATAFPGSNSAPGGFTLQATTRFVDMGLIATDKRGKPVLDLKQSDFEIYDNGRKQQVRAFHHADPAVSGSPALTAAPAPDDTTYTNTTTLFRDVQDAPDLLILLLDESHLAFLDLNRARGEVLRFLKATRPTSRLALYSVGERGFRVIQDVTQDHALVEKKLAAWTPTASSVSQAQALDRRNRQQFDTVHSAQDLNSVNGNFTETPDFITSIDPELRQMGDNPLRASLETMVTLARHFGPVPGHKSLAWIAGDSVLADFEDQTVGKEKGSKQMEAYLAHTREALNEAHIALYAVDASAIEGAAIDASLQNRNVQLNAASAENAASGGGGGQARTGNAGRTQAEMQQDLHGIQGPVRQLAESTGGRAVNKGGDLKATLEGIDQESTSLYEIGFSPDTQSDGKFHTLQVKVPSRKDVKLRYRSGYLFSEQQSSTRDRFQQAIWSPQDSTAVTLTAEALTAKDIDGEKPVIKLRISFPGLSFEQKADRWTDDLYVFVAVRDDAAQKVQISGDTLRLSLKQATYESGMPAGIPYQRSIETKSRLATIRVIVVDGNSGKIGSVTIPASVLQASAEK